MSQSRSIVYGCGNYDSLLECCELCPRRCGVNRLNGEVGFCKAEKDVKVALANLHLWEEPCLVGDNGAGTVFFSHCSLGCCFCQNYDISHSMQGKLIDTVRLSEIFLKQEDRGAASLDLVTPTHYVPQILTALELAKKRGFSLPVIYNSGGYENVEVIGMLGEFVDIFLPDIKFFSHEIAVRYANATDYFLRASSALNRMKEIVPEYVFDEKGRMLKGVIVRHMVLPGGRKDSMKILEYLWNKFEDNIYISLMSQYTPLRDDIVCKELRRKVTTFEYESVVDYADKLGFTHVYVQNKSSADSVYVPKFDGSGVS